MSESAEKELKRVMSDTSFLLVTILLFHLQNSRSCLLKWLRSQTARRPLSFGLPATRRCLSTNMHWSAVVHFHPKKRNDLQRAQMTRVEWRLDLPVYRQPGTQEVILL